MLPVPVLVVLAAAGGALLLKSIEKSQAKAVADEAARQNSLGFAATEFIQGKTYSVQLMVTSAIGTRNVVTASAVIKSTMEQTGWKILSTPVFRDPAAATAFATGQPSQWVFAGQWTKTDKFMTVTPSWLGSAMAFLLPVS